MRAVPEGRIARIESDQLAWKGRRLGRVTGRT